MTPWWAAWLTAEADRRLPLENNVPDDVTLPTAFCGRAYEGELVIELSSTSRFDRSATLPAVN